MVMNMQRRARGGRQRMPMAEINVTPMVDVMLVLLIIFMVTAPLLKAAVPVDLPDTRAKALAENGNQVTVTIATDGSVYFNELLVPPGELSSVLSTVPIAKGEVPPLVTLHADKSLDYGRVIAVMGELNRAGFNAISLVTNAATADPTGQAGVAVGSVAATPAADSASAPKADAVPDTTPSPVPGPAIGQ